MCSASIIATLSKFLNILQGEGSANVRHLCQILKMEEEIISGILKQILHIGELWESCSGTASMWEC